MVAATVEAGEVVAATVEAERAGGLELEETAAKEAKEAAMVEVSTARHTGNGTRSHHMPQCVDGTRSRVSESCIQGTHNWNDGNRYIRMSLGRNDLDDCNST